jgi:hypothetical protein
MSSNVRKYLIRYDGNDGMSYDKFIYCKYEFVWDGQKWCNEDGSSLNFDCVTDSNAFVTACCIAGVDTGDKYSYWEEIKEFDIPELVAKKFNYAYPQKIKQIDYAV